MNRLLIILAICILHIHQLSGLHVSYITWNVNDNRKFGSYTPDIVSTLLDLKSNKPLPDVYAISFQENCASCSHNHLNRLSEPFINTIRSDRAESYELVSIYATHKSSMCETVFCASVASMHGTTFMMILVKTTISISNLLETKVNTCTDAWFPNKEKGISVIGFKLNGIDFCFGGLHLDVGNSKYRQRCFDEIFAKIKNSCSVTFFGGDFNTRPFPKSHPVPSYFAGGRNQSYLDEMKETDDFSGSKPHSGGVNLLTYITKKMGMRFVEPFEQPPKFRPTYSIKSTLNCDDHPVCYEPDRFPSWTDRIIYAPASKVTCTEYTIIPSLGTFSDHLPVYANCFVA